MTQTKKVGRPRSVKTAAVPPVAEPEVENGQEVKADEGREVGREEVLLAEIDKLKAEVKSLTLKLAAYNGSGETLEDIQAKAEGQWLRYTPANEYLETFDPWTYRERFNFSNATVIDGGIMSQVAEVPMRALSGDRGIHGRSTGPSFGPGFRNLYIECTVTVRSKEIGPKPE